MSKSSETDSCCTSTCRRRRRTTRSSPRPTGASAPPPAACKRPQAPCEGRKASRLGAQAGLDLAKQRLSDAVLRAPIDGVVLEKRVDVGERLSEGTVTFVVVQTAPLKLRFRVPERFLGAAERGAGRDRGGAGKNGGGKIMPQTGKQGQGFPAVLVLIAPPVRAVVKMGMGRGQAGQGGPNPG